MRNLQYRSGVTAKKLEQAWDMPRVAIAMITAEASKRVRAEYHDDRIMSKVSVALDRVIDTAISSGDRHAVIKACAIWAQVTGAGAAQRVQVQQDLSLLTTEQLKVRKVEIMSRLMGRTIDVRELPETVDVEGGSDAAR
jgi:hypothetical protein